MIFDKLFKKDNEEKKNADSFVGDDTVVQENSNTKQNLQGDSDGGTFTGTATDIRPSEKSVKKSKSIKTNKAFDLKSRKNRTRRTVHTKRPFHRKQKQDVKTMVNVYDLIERPVVTEKVAALSEKRTYAFFIRPSATKHTVADAVEALYGVRPIKVRITKNAPKKKRIRIAGREREFGVTARRKKAYVFLKEGDSIRLT